MITPLSLDAETAAPPEVLFNATSFRADSLSLSVLRHGRAVAFFSSDGVHVVDVADSGALLDQTVHSAPAAVQSVAAAVDSDNELVVSTAASYDSVHVHRLPYDCAAECFEETRAVELPASRVQLFPLDYGATVAVFDQLMPPHLLASCDTLAARQSVPLLAAPSCAAYISSGRATPTAEPASEASSKHRAMPVGVIVVILLLVLVLLVAASMAFAALVNKKFNKQAYTTA